MLTLAAKRNLVFRTADPGMSFAMESRNDTRPVAPEAIRTTVRQLADPKPEPAALTGALRASLFEQRRVVPAAGAH